MSIHLGRHFTGLDSFSEYTLVPPTAPQATGRLTSDQAPDAEGWAGCVCWPCPEQHHPHTLKLCLTCAGAFNCSPDHPYQALCVNLQKIPHQHFPHLPPHSTPPPPPPPADWGRTFTGLADRVGGSLRRPKSSSTKRPTPPALGPQSSGDPAMLPQRAGLRTGGLAVKCAAMGIRHSQGALRLRTSRRLAPSCFPTLRRRRIWALAFCASPWRCPRGKVENRSLHWRLPWQ